jgi:hypothetical protein
MFEGKNLKDERIPSKCAFLSVTQQPNSGLGRHIVKVARSQTPGRTPLNEWSARRRGRYLHNTQQTQEMNIHVLSGIRTCDPSNRAVANLLLGALDRTAIGIGPSSQ